MPMLSDQPARTEEARPPLEAPGDGAEGKRGRDPEPATTSYEPPPLTPENARAAKARKLCVEADREWLKNVKRKICDASVVTDQIADRAIKLIRDHGMKAASKNNTVQVTLVSKADLEKMAKDESIRGIAEHRLATLSNKATLLILERLMSHKWAWLFNEPVNADELNLKDYHTIVKKPMALRTVKHRAQTGVYRTASEAASDIRLVFQNAQLYNKPGSDVNIMASAMLEKFEDLRQTKVLSKYAEEETQAKHEESVARKKRVDAVRAQQNGEFRRKCQSYERLLCDVENFLVDVQQQIIANCKPMAQESRSRAQALFRDTHFDKVKPALAVVLQRYPEMLNTSTQEVEVDLTKVDPLTLRQVLMLLDKANRVEGEGEGAADYEGERAIVESDFKCYIEVMCSLVELAKGSRGGKKASAKENGPLKKEDGSDHAQVSVL